MICTECGFAFLIGEDRHKECRAKKEMRDLLSSTTEAHVVLENVTLKLMADGSVRWKANDNNH